MSLSAFALMDLNNLALACAELGKHRASHAYSQHALAQGWHGTPAWIEGRSTFQALWRTHRAAHLARTQQAA